MNLDADMALILLNQQRANLQALLAVLACVPEAQRMTVRAAAIQALGAIEDALGCERTFEPKRIRHTHIRDVVRS